MFAVEDSCLLGLWIVMLIDGGARVVVGVFDTRRGGMAMVFVVCGGARRRIR